MSLAGDLLAWFDGSQRDQPWRNRTDPYEIWISEVMLQQTRSETVARYYERFLDRFPTVEDLAGASLEDVLALWSGLGYYRRARQLHQAARLLAERDGKLPRSVEGLLELPGIGPYTAAAIASIAFGEPVPVLDGNVERVLTRIEAMEENPRTAASRRLLLARAEQIIDRSRPGDFNQALMELGSTVCTPRRPNCPGCPVSDACRGFRQGRPENYPALPKRQRPILERRIAVVVRSDGRLLMSRRGDDARQLAGVWELPWVPTPEEETGVPTALGERYGGDWRVEPARGRVRHSITTRALEVMVTTGDWRPPEADFVSEARHLGWVAEDELDGVATTSLVGKALELIADG